MNTMHGQAAEYHAMLEGLNAEDGALQGPQQLSYDAGTNSLANKVWEGTCTTIDYVLLRLNGAVIGPVTRRISVIKHPWRKRQHDLSDHYGVVCELWLP
jgi:hypothetical protein